LTKKQELKKLHKKEQKWRESVVTWCHDEELFIWRKSALFWKQIWSHRATMGGIATRCMSVRYRATLESASPQRKTINRTISSSTTIHSSRFITTLKGGITSEGEQGGLKGRQLPPIMYYVRLYITSFKKYYIVNL
jgi:hypothetical protein